MTELRIKLATAVIAGAAVVLASGGIAGAAQKGAAQNAGAKPAKASQCAGCHGANGMGNASAGFPALAGLPPKYLDHQLWAFVHGTRHNSIMKGMAKGLDAKSRKRLATYYATMKVVPPKSLPAPPKGDLGKTIAIHGLHTDTSKAVPACESCHGAGGLGQGEFPRLAGQPAGYLAGQLKDWKKGSRKDSLMHIMRSVSDKLSAKDIKAVAGYFASLSPAPQASQNGGGSGQSGSGSGQSGSGSGSSSGT